MSVNRWKVLLVLSLVVILLGCGDKETARWRGAVTLDGAPVESGTVRFEPAGGAGQTAGATIVDGQYSVELAPGTYTVEVRAYRQAGERPAYGGGDETVPEMEDIGHYRDTVEVTGSEVRDFALEKP